MGHPGKDIQMEMTALFMWVENGIFSLAASINHPELYVLLFW